MKLVDTEDGAHLPIRMCSLFSQSIEVFSGWALLVCRQDNDSFEATMVTAEGLTPKMLYHAACTWRQALGSVLQSCRRTMLVLGIRRRNLLLALTVATAR